jgi:hypothetical protein
MNEKSSALGHCTLAALVAATAYVLAYSQDVTLFYYYPMVGQWHWLPQGEDLGPRITYFGWKAIGLLAGVVALLLPRRWLARLPADTVWMGGMALTAVVCVHESHWFLR